MGIDTVYEQDMQTAHIIQPAEEMAAIIQQFDNIVIVAHGSPDGDAIGATGAMGSLVKALGKRFVLYNATGIPDYLEWVPLPGKLVTKPSAIPFKPGLIVSAGLRRRLAHGQGTARGLSRVSFRQY